MEDITRKRTENTIEKPRRKELIVFPATLPIIKVATQIEHITRERAEYLRKVKMMSFLVTDNQMTMSERSEAKLSVKKPNTAP